MCQFPKLHEPRLAQVRKKKSEKAVEGAGKKRR